MSLLDLPVDEMKLEIIKQRALEAHVYIVDEKATLLTFKTYEDDPKDDRVILSNISLDRAMEVSANDGFHKAKYTVVKSFEDFQFELVVVECENPDCYRVLNFRTGWDQIILKETTEDEIKQLWQKKLKS